MKVERVMSGDPNGIANSLIQELGIDGAVQKAMSETATASREGNNFNLSVWREVKRILRERMESLK